MVTKLWGRRVGRILKSMHFICCRSIAAADVSATAPMLSLMVGFCKRE